MNWSEVQGRWEQLNGLLKVQWPDLSDEDLAGIRGERAGLARALQARYGYGEIEAEREICDFEKDVRFPGAVK